MSAIDLFNNVMPLAVYEASVESGSSSSTGTGTMSDPYDKLANRYETPRPFMPEAHYDFTR